MFVSNGEMSYPRLMTPTFAMASSMGVNTSDFLELIALSDARSGHYRFDYEGIKKLEEYLGAFQCYITAPLVNLLPEVQ